MKGLGDHFTTTNIPSYMHVLRPRFIIGLLVQLFVLSHILANFQFAFIILEKMKWEMINTESTDEQIPKPRAGHCAVSVSLFECRCLISYTILSQLHMNI